MESENVFPPIKIPNKIGRFWREPKSGSGIIPLAAA